MIKAVIFDLDGTLLDTVADIAAAHNRALRHYGMPEQVNLNSNCRVAHNALCTATAKSMES